MFEQLEARRLLSAVVSFSDGTTASQSGSGSVTIKMDKATKGGSKGGASASAMNITVLENEITQVPNGPTIGLGNVLVHDNTTGEETVIYGLKPGKVVHIQGGKGNDTIFFQGQTVSADIKGDDGSDNITVLDKGNVSSKIDSGDGDDVVAIVYSKNADIKTGKGNDVVLINTAADFNNTFDFDYSLSNIKVNTGGSDTVIEVFAGQVDAHGGHFQIVNA